jgi:hypothetical protein
MRLIGTLSTFLWALAACAQGNSTFEWKGTVQPGQTVEIRNITGDIKAEAAPGPDVEIHVRVTGTRPDPDTIRIDVVEYDGGVLFCTIYEGLNRPDHCTLNQSPSVTLLNSDVRVTYTVLLPADVHLAGRTVNGNITVDLPDSPVSASTVNGRIVLATGKAADAHVVNGSILATLAAVDWEGTREFGTVNGSIDLEVPETCSAHVRAGNVWGSLANDFAVPVHRNLVGSWFEGDLNGGGPRLLLGTVNGSIHLRKSPAQ